MSKQMLSTSETTKQCTVLSTPAQTRSPAKQIGSPKIQREYLEAYELMNQKISKRNIQTGNRSNKKVVDTLTNKVNSYSLTNLGTNTIEYNNSRNGQFD